jgi:uncharacterized protein YjbI with pentapeptide repeats
MAKPWIRRIGKAAIATAVVILTATALLWATTVLWGQWWSRVDARAVLAIAVLAGVPLAALLAAIWWLWWRLPRRQVHKLDIQIPDPKARADTEDNFRKTVGQALGGAAILIGAVAAYLQFTQQQRASEQQSLRQVVSNQVSKGFEQLASDKLSMRLGGIYALEGVMNSSPEYHQPVLEALCAFVRDRTTENVTFPRPTDVKAAVSVIGRRTPGSGIVDLAASDIRGTNLSTANLNGAQLNNADLTGTSLFTSDLTGANLRHAKLNGAQLDAAILIGAQLNDADLTDAKLDNADLRGAALPRSNLQRADLRGAILRAIEPDGSFWIEATLSESDLSDADLSGADLTGADLINTNLSGADLSGAVLSDARNLTQEQLDKACGKPKALPPGLILDKPCPLPSADSR